MTRCNIEELASHFGQFGDSQMIGIANDLTPHYWARSSTLCLHFVIMAIVVTMLFDAYCFLLAPTGALVAIVCYYRSESFYQYT